MANRDKDNPGPAAALTPVTMERSQVPQAQDRSEDGFVPGTVFAGRYRMVTRVGRGGMGEVWRADDLVLRTPVALKLVYSTSPGARERLLREVRLARQITHAAVCRVFDVGEADGQAFYSMEFVEGEDLSTLIRRAGRLPQERVLAIARQICEGLAAAHAQGVLHRDLKPANVLMDGDGAIRVTDFGIAIARTEGADRTIIGTPGYMAPEQLTAGAPLSERTDIYAIGLLLYELLVGQRPFADTGRVPGVPPRPSALVPDVDPRLERIILRALAPAPSDRPASAAAMADALPPVAPARSRPRRLAWLAGAAMAATVVLLAVLASLAWPRRAPALTDQDTIVLADFVNTTGEPVFDGTLNVALAVALEQSPFLKVFPDAAVRDTLRLMKRSPDEPMSRSLARDIALRERFTALGVGSISPLGTHYVITLEAISAESGDVMAREQVEVPGKEQVLTQLGEATARFREKLGESLPSIQKFDVPLARATTASLEALQAYSLALDEGRMFLRVQAIPHLKRAIELDPDFALAHALLSGVYANTSQSAEAQPHARRAYELRDRVSERERYFISWRYYVDALQAWDRALELATSWVASYPREAFAFNSLGLAAATFGQHERAIDAFLEAIRLDARFVPPHRNLIESLVELNRLDEAKAEIERAASTGIGSIGIRQMSYVVALMTGDRRALSDAVRQERDLDGPMWALNSEGRAATYAGRLRAAHGQLQQAVQLAVEQNLEGLAAGWALEDAEAHALAGQCVEARREAEAGLRLSRDSASIPRAARTLAVCGDADTAARLTDELSTRFPEATLNRRIHLPVVAAIVAVGQRRPMPALQLLEPLQSYEQAPATEFWPSYLRGLAHLQLGDGAAAASDFQAILNRRGLMPTSPIYPLAQLGLARATAMAGDTTKARASYQAFLRLWQEADADIRPLNEAREESARLQ